MTEFLPNWAEPPGGTIEDVLRERRLSVGELASSVGRKREELVDLLEGRVSLDLEFAKGLEAGLGLPAGFWLALEQQYRSDLERVTALRDEPSKRAAWVRNLPLLEMKHFGWVEQSGEETDFEACLRFFGVPSIPAWEMELGRALGGAALRTSQTFHSNDAVVFSWLRRGELLGRAQEARPWDADGLREAIPDMRALSRKAEPSHFLPELQAIAARHGVAVVVARSPSGCRASGVTRFLSSDRALLLLSFRYLSDDHFWFTFFHEVGHLLLHGRDNTFLECSNAEPNQLELEANEFAANVLVPLAVRDELFSLPLEHKAVMRFARRIGVAPGIVVGQLQHHGVLNRSWLNRLKRRYQWESSH